MTILINEEKTELLSEGRKKVFFAITDSNGNEYRWHGNILPDIDVQAYLEMKEEEILLLIRRQEYPEMPAEIQTLEEAEKWIKDGCKIKVQVGVDEIGKPIYEEKVAEKIKFRNTWE